MHYEGEQAIEKWIQREARLVHEKWDASNWLDTMNIGDFAMLGVTKAYNVTIPEPAIRWVTERNHEFINEEDKEAHIKEESATSIWLWVYRGFEIIRLTPFSDVALFLILGLLTALVWVLSGPASATKRGETFAVPATA